MVRMDKFVYLIFILPGVRAAIFQAERAITMNEVSVYNGTGLQVGDLCCSPFFNRLEE